MLKWLLLATLVVTACESSPIVWKDPLPLAAPPVPARLVVDSSGQARFMATASSVRPPTLPAESLCVASLRTAPGTAHLFAAWWRVRRDSSAILQLARSTDSGKSWGRPIAVDTTDMSTAGCSRPSPSLATVGDDVYVAYSMIAPEGTGVFFAHTMGSMLHAPVSVIYGERLVATAIAAEGDRAVVAYEEPNGTREQVDLALSSTQGHIFEWHTTASRSVDAGTSPAVALGGQDIAVSWLVARAGDTTGNRVVRVGRIQ
jgi:hypothetical protein